MVSATEVKRIVLGLGADVCGIAPAGRFEGAPEGFRPVDVFPTCRSVIAFGKRLPVGPLYATGSLPYTCSCDTLIAEIDRIALMTSLALEDLGVRAVGVPADDPSDYWEPERQYARGALSMRHAAHLAGLGFLGRNTLLKNPEYGNMLQLGAILLDAELSADPVAPGEACPRDCRICIEACPRDALGEEGISQELCRPLSNRRNARGFKLYQCWQCRKVCPDALGFSPDCQSG